MLCRIRKDFKLVREEKLVESAVISDINDSNLLVSDMMYLQVKMVVRVDMYIVCKHSQGN